MSIIPHNRSRQVRRCYCKNVRNRKGEGIYVGPTYIATALWASLFISKLLNFVLQASRSIMCLAILCHFPCLERDDNQMISLETKHFAQTTQHQHLRHTHISRRKKHHVVRDVIELPLTWMTCLVSTKMSSSSLSFSVSSSVLVTIAP